MTSTTASTITVTGLPTRDPPDGLTGSTPFIPDIPGINGANVVEVRRVLNGEVKTGHRVAVIGAEEHMQSRSVAGFLAEQGCEVEVVTPSHFAGVTVEPETKQAVYRRLYQKGVAFTPDTAVKEISSGAVVVYNVFTRKERRIENVDTVVVAFSSRENNGLYYALQGKVKELHRIGDANGVRRVHDATREGAVVGRLL